MSVSKFDEVAELVLKRMCVVTALVLQGTAWVEGDVLHYRIVRLDKAGRIKARGFAAATRRAHVQIDEEAAGMLRAIQEEDS